MRHVIDRSRAARGARLVRYTSLERQRGQKVRPQAEALRRAPKGLSASLRVRRFLQIARAAT